MPLMIVGDLSDNTLRIDPNVSERMNGTLTFLGTGNVVEFDGDFIAHGVFVTLGGGAHLRLGEDCVAGQLEIYVTRGGQVTIGARSAFNGMVRLLVHEEASIIIGSDCLFGADVVVTASDMHSILDVATSLRLNPARDVVIGDKVWLGYRAFVAKGSKIGNGSVVGAQSVVAGIVAPQTLVAGQPARLLREGIDWCAELL